MAGGGASIIWLRQASGMQLGEANIVWLRQASGMQQSQLTATEAGKEHAAGAGKWLQAETSQ